VHETLDAVGARRVDPDYTGAAVLDEVLARVEALVHRVVLRVILEAGGYLVCEVHPRRWTSCDMKQNKAYYQ